MSNHGRDENRTLADELREESLYNAKDRVTILIKNFQRSAKIASMNGKRKIEFTIIVKDNFKFVTNETIDAFRAFLDESGFTVYDYAYVDEVDIMEPFYHFVIGW